MYSIAICDDNAKDLQKLSLLLHDYLQDHGMEAQVEVFSHPDQLLQVNYGFDIYLLDMVMPMYTGIEVGRRLREKHHSGQIIYITSSNDYAVDAFTLKATHYVLKPYTKEHFAEAMKRALSVIGTNKSQYICIKNEDGTLHTIDLNDFYYVESQKHMLMVYTAQHTIATRRTLSSLGGELEQLAPKQFICPHKGYLVNQKEILSISKDSITLKNGGIVPVARRNYSALQETYLTFLFGKNGGGV